ncbi:MAG: zinc-ribbon protein [Flaviaesturariibacter sp.]|nr:zinc-ribbon protein [Flaviaesturariibacter sp.]
MIIYGRKGKLQARQTLVQPCPHCGTTNSVEMSVFQNYAHVFFIPFFPLGKTAVSQCQHCQQVLRLNQMPPDWRQDYDTLRSTTRVPVWMFAGVALIAVLIASSAYSDAQKTKNTQSYIGHLQPGDLLEVKLEGNFTYFKVTDVRGDSVSLLYNKQMSVYKSGMDKLTVSESGFDPEVHITTQQTIQKLHKDGDIIDVVRPVN